MIILLKYLSSVLNGFDTCLCYILVQRRHINTFLNLSKLQISKQVQIKETGLNIKALQQVLIYFSLWNWKIINLVLGSDKKTGFPEFYWRGSLWGTHHLKICLKNKIIPRTFPAPLVSLTQTNDSGTFSFNCSCFCFVRADWLVLAALYKQMVRRGNTLAVHTERACTSLQHSVCLFSPDET